MNFIPIVWFFILFKIILRAYVYDYNSKNLGFIQYLSYLGVTCGVIWFFIYALIFKPYTDHGKFYKAKNC